MMTRFDSYLSTTDIARLAEVRTPAVSNWRRRHQDFPQPANRATGEELFLASDVAAWLDRRKIAKNSLQQGEPAVTTYGDRFRRNLKASEAPSSESMDPSPSANRDTAESASSDWTINETRILVETLWRVIDELRGSTDLGTSAEFVLGLLYLRSRDPMRWDALARATGHASVIGFAIDEAMREHERANPEIRGALPKAPSGTWDSWQLVAVLRLLDHLGTPEGSNESGQTASLAAIAFRSLLDRTATAEGLGGAEHFTPGHLVKLMVTLVAPAPAERIYDPCCGSGDLLVRAVAHVERGSNSADLSVCGQTLGERPWRLAKMNLAINGVTADLGPRPANTLSRDLHPEEHFDVVLSNPPFNMRRWTDADPSRDTRWWYGVPPEHNANFAWLQHIASVLSVPGRAAVLMANGAAVSENARERAIRAAMIDDGWVESVVALPPQLFRSTAVPVTCWLLRNRVKAQNRDVLFIDATEAGTMADRTHRVLTDTDIDRITGAYHDWRRRAKSDRQECADFSRPVALAEIQDRGYNLNPLGYVTAPTTAVDAATASIELRRLRQKLENLRARSVEVDAAADQQLKRVGAWKP